jgi:hypothetical protein
LYETFEPAEAKRLADRLADRLELHYTPKHGSWLNMAEIELAVLAGQCLDRRLADRATLEREVAAWQAARNGAGRGSTGASPPRTPASSSSTSILQFRADKLLGCVCNVARRTGLGGEPVVEGGGRDPRVRSWKQDLSSHLDPPLATPDRDQPQ